MERIMRLALGGVAVVGAVCDGHIVGAVYVARWALGVLFPSSERS